MYRVGGIACIGNQPRQWGHSGKNAGGKRMFHITRSNKGRWGGVAALRLSLSPLYVPYCELPAIYLTIQDGRDAIFFRYFIF